MNKIDFSFFFGQLLNKNLCYTKISETLKDNHRNVGGFLVPSITNICKKNNLSSGISENNVKNPGTKRIIRFLI